MTDISCELAQVELSAAHDEDGPVSEEVAVHTGTCVDCQAFADGLASLDYLLATGQFELAPDVAPRVIGAIPSPRGQWWSVAAAALIGLIAGAVVGGAGTRLETSRAQDLDELFHAVGTALNGLSAELLVVERGFHEDVPERVYLGSIDYVAPERLAIELVDTTDYPDSEWVANDVQLTLADGEMVVSAGSPCPVAGMPACLLDPSIRAFRNVAPFDSGVLTPLEIIGPGRSLTWPSGLDVLGHQNHDGRPAIQVRSTVAAVDLIAALVDHGAWRDFHPTDEVVMWLDEATLVPVRLEVFAAESAERDLWQLRRGYADTSHEQPILIVELSNLTTELPEIDLDLPAEAVSAGFVDGPIAVPRPTLPTGFQPHRSGQRPLGEGGLGQVSTWSDGRSWLMIEATDDWEEPHLFGMSLPFVTRVDLGDGSVGYLAPSGDRLAVHGEDGEVVVSGSVPIEMLIDVAASHPIRGVVVPDNWLEASTVEISHLPEGTLVPDVEGWASSARVEDGATSILLGSGGSRTILITQRRGSALDAPVGPDIYEVEVRGFVGRFDAANGVLEWIEDGLVLEMRSDTVGRAVLVEVAESMRSR